MFEFLLSYRNPKRRKQASDVIILIISFDSSEPDFYHNFLCQVFDQLIKRIMQNKEEYIYKRLLKEVRKGDLFKKFLLFLRLFYFTLMKKSFNAEKNFKRQLGNFAVRIRELLTNRCESCSRNPKKEETSLVLINSLRSSEKVDLIGFCGKIMDNETIDKEKIVEFNVMNFLKKLSEERKRIYLGQSVRFWKYEIDKKIIGKEILQREMIGFRLFQNEQLMKSGKVFGFFLEKIY
jgi:hypothetical protein